MKTSVEIPRTLERWLATGVGPLAGTGLPWLDAARDRARERVRDQGIPTMKDEGWRYTSVKSLTDQPFTLFAEDVTGVEQEDLEDLLIPDLDAHRAVLVNGRFVPGLSSLGDLPAGARAGGLRAILESDPDALEGRLNHVSGDGVHVFSALNTAGLDDGFVFLVDAGVTVERPVELVHLSVGMDEPRLAQPRHVIDLADGAEARIIERYVSLGESLYCTNSVLEVSLGKGARLDHDRVQLESRNAYHITGFYLSQAEDSRYRGVNLGLGGTWARTDLVVRFAGEHADCDLKGLYLAGDGQVMDYQDRKSVV